MPPRADDSTLDPTTADPDPSADGDLDRLEPGALLLFHPDLSRIGGWARLEGDGTVAGGVVGREAPVFSFSHRDAAEPIADPCISRKQLRVRFDRPTSLFSVEILPDARRRVSLMGPEGRAVAGPLLSPGSVVLVEGRVALALALRPDRASVRHHGLVGESAAMTRLRLAIDEVATLDDIVSIQGETGVGKERVALAIHQASARSSAPFVAVNCAALPENLVESELFGSVRGAYTGATGQMGLLRAAEGGTLLLDEIGELPLSVQAKLLRVLETRRVRPVGAAREHEVSVRLLTATHRDLHLAVRQGAFRDDLHARLGGFSIHVPTLRSRKEDIPGLLAHFTLARLRELARENASAGRLLATWTSAPSRAAPHVPVADVLRLMQHRWPHNVRQLVRYAAVRASRAVSSGDLRFPAPDFESDVPLDSVAPNAKGSEGRRSPRGSGCPPAEELLSALEMHGHVQSKVAEAYDVSAPTIDRWMRELGLRRAADLAAEDIREALDKGGNLSAAAKLLRVSVRGLKLRLRETSSDDREPEG